MKRILLFLSLCAAVILSAPPVKAQDLRSDPGYLDLTSIEGWFDQEPWLEVNIKGALLKLITEASRNEDPELTSLLGKLKAIEVRGYPLSPAQFADIGRRTSLLSKQLESKGWETIVRVRERRDENQQVNIFMKVNRDVIAGLVVMVLQPDEEEGAVFVNIVGDIDPAQIGKIGQKFNINPLEDIGSK
jgi:hypothetical protein